MTCSHKQPGLVVAVPGKAPEKRSHTAPVSGLSLLLVAATAILAGCSGQTDSPQQRRHISGPVPFSYSVVDAKPDSGKECCADILAVGDLNNDGFSDLVIGSQGGEVAGLVWYAFPLWEKHVISQGEFTTDGKIADIDGDGYADIIAGEMEKGFSWFRNPGPDDSAAWSRRVIDKGYVHDVEIADMDGDGDLDLVTCDKKRVILWLQESSEQWTSAVLLEKKAEGLALSDINRDGRVDVVLGGVWLEAPRESAGSWVVHTIAEQWPADTRVVVTDLNADDRPDVVLSASEGPGQVSWFEQGVGNNGEVWLEHPVTKETLEGAHSLQVADMDLDGDLDIVTAEMHTSPGRRVTIYLQSDDQWTPFLISERGSHNLQVADLDADGDFDIIGKNYAGKGARPLELWESLVANIAADKPILELRSQEDSWRYLAIDAARPPSQKEKMGLVFADINSDGKQDVIAGSIIYKNPGGALAGWWPRIALPEKFDAHFSANVDGDEYPDIIGFSGTDIVWLEAEDRAGERWAASKVGSAPEGRVQGAIVAQLEAGGSPELLFTKGNSLAYLRIPLPGATDQPWQLSVISADVEESGVVAGDLDRDGDIDIATVAGDGHHVVWFENPSRDGDSWSRHDIGASSLWIDRLALTDINGDGRSDLIASEESRDGLYKARLYWFEAPPDPRSKHWRRRSVLTLRSINSMDVADFDGDGVAEIVIAEHTDLRNGEWAPDNVTAIVHNRLGGRQWALTRVEVDQHSSHLGGRIVDLDGDGRYEIVSIGWEQYCCVHVWTQNDAANGRATNSVLSEPER